MLLLVTSVALAAGAVVGIEPFWPVEEVSLSEAATLEDIASVVQMIRHGADPSAPAPVRAGVLRAHAVRVTPVEAAVDARRADVLRVLLGNGATLSAPARLPLLCHAEARDAEDVVALLASLPPAIEPSVTCAGVAPVERLKHLSLDE